MPGKGSPRDPSVSGARKRAEHSREATPVENQRAKVSDDIRMDQLQIEAAAKGQTPIPDIGDAQFTVNPVFCTGEEYLSNQEMIDSESEEAEDVVPDDFLEEHMAKLEDFDNDEHEKREDIVELKSSRDNDLVGKCTFDVTVIAIPAETETGKRPPPSNKGSNPKAKHASSMNFKFALVSTIGMHVKGDMSFEVAKELASRRIDGPKGAVIQLAFPLVNQKQQLLRAAKDKKSSLNGTIGGFRCRYQDTNLYQVAKYEGWLK